MLTGEARVTTERANRYLVQLCEHLDQIGQHHGGRSRMHSGAPGAIPRVEWSGSHGVITFDNGQCTLDATADALTLSARAADADGLRRIQDELSRRLETIGRRDGLTVSW
jgi:hypothetical protein